MLACAAGLAAAGLPNVVGVVGFVVGCEAAAAARAAAMRSDTDRKPSDEAAVLRPKGAVGLSGNGVPFGLPATWGSAASHPSAAAASESIIAECGCCSCGRGCEM